MNMKKLFAFCIAAFAALLLISSCNKFDPSDPQEVYGSGFYVLNNGNWGSNDANIGIIDFQTRQVQKDAFKTSNGKALGDVGQDAISYGSNLFISVYGSATVFVTDKMNLKIEKAINGTGTSGETLSPRYFAAHGDNVYVSFYEGYVGAIDTLTLSLKSLVKVGDNPEEIVYANNKLFVANSGGMNYPNYGHTVSVIDPAKMEVVEEIEVGINPNRLEVDKDENVYVLSWGDYAATPAQLQVINSTSYNVSSVSEVKDPYDMAMGLNGKLYVLTSSYDENWNAVTDIVVYDTKEKRYLDMFSSMATELKNKYSISTDLSLGDIAQGMVFIGTSDYISTGDIYVFDVLGNLLTQMDTGGLNPIKVIPVSYSFFI